MRSKKKTEWGTRRNDSCKIVQSAIDVSVVDTLNVYRSSSAELSSIR